MNGQLNHSLNVKSICGDFDFLGSRGSGENLHARIVDEILEKKQSAMALRALLMHLLMKFLD